MLKITKLQLQNWFHHGVGHQPQDVRWSDEQQAWIYAPPPPKPEEVPPNLAAEVRQIGKQIGDLVGMVDERTGLLRSLIGDTRDRLVKHIEQEKIEMTQSGIKSVSAVRKADLGFGINFEEEARAIRRENEQLTEQQKQLNALCWSTRDGAEPWEKCVEEVRADTDRRMAAVRDEITALQFVIGMNSLAEWQREALIRVLKHRLEDLEI